MFVKVGNKTMWQPKEAATKNDKTTPEAVTEYVDHAQGKKHCFNCSKFNKEQSACTGEKFKENTSRPANAEGNIPVHPVGVCKYWAEK